MELPTSTAESRFSLSPDGGKGGVGGPTATATSTVIAGAAVGLIDRLKRWPRPDAARSFDAALAESVEDVELRRKLATGRAGSVR
ncbi:MAG TPA: hypothetical protein VF341_09190 [Anaeromyxobacteraceae bacterium]